MTEKRLAEIKQEAAAKFPSWTAMRDLLDLIFELKSKVEFYKIRASLN